MNSNITAKIQELHESQNWNEIVALYNQNEQEFTNITSSNIDENCLIIELRMIFAKAFYKMKDLEKSYNLFFDGVDYYDLSIDMYPNFSKEHLKLNLSALAILELLSDLTRKYEMWESFNSVVMKQITIYKETYEMTQNNEYSSKFFKYLNLYAAFILTDGKEYIENFPEILEFYHEKTIPYGIAEFVQIQTFYVEYFEKLNMKKELLNQLKYVNELFLQIYVNETFTPEEFKPFFSYYFGNFKKYYDCNQDDKTFFLDNIDILKHYLENFSDEPDQEYEEVQKIVASI